MVRRELGQGRWDKILMKRMVDLSYADNYEEAKEEWIATGDVWWNGNGDVPEWVSQNSHPNQCLCGHNIVYHFRIRNTITDAEEIVGSDHINSYLIMRQIAKEMQKDIGQVTDAEVERWLKERVGSMKAEAWWKENGESFSSMFNKVKELDCFLNTTQKGYFWDEEIGTNSPTKVLRKKGKGKPFTADYRMASIVWRWNHPDNPKNQLVTRGTPTDKVMQDLSWLFVMYETLEPRLIRHKERRARLIEDRNKQRLLTRRRQEERAARIAKQQAEYAERERIRAEQWEADRPAREERQRLERIRREEERKQREENAIKAMKTLLESEPNAIFIENCRFLGLPVLHKRIAVTFQELDGLYRFKKSLSKKAQDAGRQLYIIKEMLGKQATIEQLKVLRKMGLIEQEVLRLEVEGITRLEAERKIETLGEKE